MTLLLQEIPPEQLLATPNNEFEIPFLSTPKTTPIRASLDAKDDKAGGQNALIPDSCEGMLEEKKRKRKRAHKVFDLVMEIDSPAMKNSLKNKWVHVRNADCTKQVRGWLEVKSQCLYGIFSQFKKIKKATHLLQQPFSNSGTYISTQ